MCVSLLKNVEEYREIKDSHRQQVPKLDWMRQDAGGISTNSLIPGTLFLNPTSLS